MIAVDEPQVLGQVAEAAPCPCHSRTRRHGATPPKWSMVYVLQGAAIRAAGKLEDSVLRDVRIRVTPGEEVEADGVAGEFRTAIAGRARFPRWRSCPTRPSTSGSGYPTNRIRRRCDAWLSSAAPVDGQSSRPAPALVHSHPASAAMARRERSLKWMTSAPVLPSAAAVDPLAHQIPVAQEPVKARQAEVGVEWPVLALSDEAAQYWCADGILRIERTRPAECDAAPVWREEP